LDKRIEGLNLADLVKKLRMQKGFSQKKFAQKSGLSSSTISRIESGETSHPDIETLKLLAKHLEYPESKLISLLDINNSTAAIKSAKINFLQQPVRKINRYSSVITPIQEIEAVQVQEQRIEPAEIQVQSYTALEVSQELSNTEMEKRVALKGMRLITLRLERNTTQKELADSLGIDKTLISQYEGEIIKPDYHTVMKLADFFGVSIEYLTGESMVERFIPTAPVEIQEEINTKVLNQNDLRQEYLIIAEEIQAAGIEIEDVRAFIHMIKKYNRQS
jgi:transcriptional regulator with XRE-family HTH domain